MVRPLPKKSHNCARTEREKERERVCVSLCVCVCVCVCVKEREGVGKGGEGYWYLKWNYTEELLPFAGSCRMQSIAVPVTRSVSSLT